MKKILIIDDNHQNRLLIKMILEKNGYIIIEADSGINGIKLAEQEKPDLILLDMMMPEINGWEVMKTLKGNVNTMNIPVIIFSALDEISEIDADGYISKPIDLIKLLEIVSEMLK